MANICEDLNPEKKHLFNKKINKVVIFILFFKNKIHSLLLFNIERNKKKRTISGKSVYSRRFGQSK